MRHAPRRTCIGCRAVRERSELIRVVLSEEGAVALDPRGTLPGRGAYLCAEQACFERAAGRKAFNRAFRRTVAVAADLRQTFIAHLERKSMRGSDGCETG